MLPASYLHQGSIYLCLFCDEHRCFCFFDPFLLLYKLRIMDVWLGSSSALRSISSSLSPVSSILSLMEFFFLGVRFFSRFNLEIYICDYFWHIIENILISHLVEPPKLQPIQPRRSCLRNDEPLRAREDVCMDWESVFSQICHCLHNISASSSVSAFRAISGKLPLVSRFPMGISPIIWLLKRTS